MTTHNFNGNRPEASGGAKGEVVTPQFQTLKQEIKKLKDVSIEEEENKIIIWKDGLEITLENLSDESDYWVYTIKAQDENDKAEIYISSAKQVCKLKFYPQNQKVDINYEIKNERIEEDLYICTKAEYSVSEIELIIDKYQKHGVIGLYEYFKTEFLDTIL